MAVRQSVWSLSPRIFSANNSGRLSVEVWSTPCIVQHPLGGWCDALIVPANESLVQTALPYFPIGGPVPKPPPPGLSNAAWGGMEAGEGMLYSTQVVDGALAECGGKELAELCLRVPTDEHGKRCPVGTAVATASPVMLKASFGQLVHTVPPFRSSAMWGSLLAQCYTQALGVCLKGRNGRTTVALPLLGAGARGAQPDEAALVAAGAIGAWVRGRCTSSSGAAELVLRFGCIDQIAECALERALESTWGHRAPV